MKLFGIIFIAVIAISSVYAKEKFFVVERENSSLATIYEGLKRSNIEGMHDMNHGVVKFDGKDGYAISRDGFVIKFDPESEKILAEYKNKYILLIIKNKNNKYQVKVEIERYDKYLFNHTGFMKHGKEFFNYDDALKYCMSYIDTNKKLNEKYDFLIKSNNNFS